MLPHLGSSERHTHRASALAASAVTCCVLEGGVFKKAMNDVRGMWGALSLLIVVVVIPAWPQLVCCVLEGGAFKEAMNNVRGVCVFVALALLVVVLIPTWPQLSCAVCWSRV